MPLQPKTALPIDWRLLPPGLRLAVAVSGGADSIALLRALHAEAPIRGLALHVAHFHHGLRGEEADGDLAFVHDLAANLGLPFHHKTVDTATEAAARPGKPAETIEEAARRLRYGWLRSLMSDAVVDAVTTAHTRDDQAETVLAKFLRGAWTEGLSGIHPVVECQPGQVIRPLLGANRAEIEAYLRALNQPWRDDSTNKHITYTRNRIRHELLPSLDAWNPQIRDHLAQMAELARDEESFWSAETERSAAALILPGRPVRGGGRAAAQDIAIDIDRLSNQPPALQRRIVRFAAAKLGVSPDFQATECLRHVALTGRAGQKCELAGGVRAERTHRELRLSMHPVQAAGPSAALLEIPLAIPGETAAPAFGLSVRLELETGTGLAGPAILRAWKAGDRVRLKYSSGERKVKEVLERMKVVGAERARWPVVVCDGKVIWMQGVKVEPLPGVNVTVIER